MGFDIDTFCCRFGSNLHGWEKKCLSNRKCRDVETFIAEWSNGKTTGFDPVNNGSIPFSVSMLNGVFCLLVKYLAVNEGNRVRFPETPNFIEGCSSTDRISGYELEDVGS